MKYLNTLWVLALITLSTTISAQTPAEIISAYHENTGGAEAWKALEGVKFTGKMSQGGMEFPVEMVQTKEGEAYMKFSFQGLEFFQNVYDGSTLWSTNQMTMKPEKASAEDLANHQLNLNDFPDALIDYESKGYTAELVGTESFDGTECYKIKLVTEPVTVNGEEKESVSFYYFDTESSVLLGSENEVMSGQMAGAIQQVKFSDYDEVNGLYFPFTMAMGVKDGMSVPLTMESIELNPEWDKAVLTFPETKE